MRRAWCRAGVAALALSATGCLFDWARFGPADDPVLRDLERRAADCLARPAAQITRDTGARAEPYRVERPSGARTYDLRGLVATTAEPFPIGLGDDGFPASELCVVGGSAVGTLDRAALQPTIADGAALSTWGAGGHVIDGFRAENTHGGLSLHGDRVYARGLYLRYVRGVCVRNEDGIGGVIADSLFDGCWRGLRLDRQAPREPLLLDHVLLRMQAMPTDDSGGTYACDDRSGTGHAEPFDVDGSDARLVLRDVVLLVEKLGVRCAGSMAFPRGTTAERVTLVWLGGGSYPGANVPAGVTVTDDLGVWERARAAWFARHGEFAEP